MTTPDLAAGTPVTAAPVPQAAPPAAEPIAPAPATTARWHLRKKARWFLAQFVVVMASVLAALALNAWYQARLDAASEANYLALLSRDVQGTLDDLQQLSAFETLQMEDALMVRRALSAAALPADTESLSLAMARLGTRRTLALRNSTYTDLLSTGNLDLIRNSVLRDNIVKFYQETEVQFSRISKNNAFFVDDMYNANVIYSGLILSRPGNNANVASQGGVDAMLIERLETDLSRSPDRLWSLPRDAPEWAMVTSNVTGRLRIAAAAVAYSDERTQAAQALKDEIESERTR
jgi:hypothetical protein